MKSLHKYINEKLIINVPHKIVPKTKDTLITSILDHFNNGDGDLNDINVSKLREEDFYHLFHDLNDEIKKNNITKIDISDWELKELYYDLNEETGMFELCDTLETVILPDCLKVINQYTFFTCKNLSNVIIPNLVTVIGNRAFYDCCRLESIVIPASVTFIEKMAFWDCFNLTITVPNERVKKLVKNSGFKGEIIIKNNNI